MFRAGLKWIFLIMGTIMGAGYASGREIWQFFGHGSGLAILLFTLLFTICTNVILTISSETQSSDYFPVLKKIAGEKLTPIYDYMILLYLFCITVVMIAGSGASFQAFGFPKWWGILFIVFAIYLIFRKGINALLTINELLMPLLILGLLLLLVSFIDDQRISIHFNWDDQSNWAAAFPFTALNILPLIAVLGAIGNKITSRGEIYIASIGSGLILGVVTLIYNSSLVHIAEQMVIYDIPLFAILYNYNLKITIIMAVLLWIAIFTTAASTMLGIVTRVMRKAQQSIGKIVLFTLFFMLPFSAIGFSQLISVIYPIYGLLNLYILVKLIFYPIWNRVE